jgi:hypothetical protein
MFLPVTAYKGDGGPFLQQFDGIFYLSQGDPRTAGNNLFKYNHWTCDFTRVHPD